MAAVDTREMFRLASEDATFATRYNDASWSTIGEGVFAVIGRIHCNDLNREVAVKLFKALIPAGSDLKDRIVAEVVNAQRISSPHVVRVHSPFFRPSGLTWIEMALAVGTNLREYLHRQPRLPFERARELAAALMDGLKAAHAAEVVHRDIKPHNLLVPDSPPPALLILDFGISKAGEAARLTASSFPGTPLYASPEGQAGRPVGPPGDVYSASCVLYELFTGEFPWAINMETVTPAQMAAVHTRCSGEPRRARQIAGDAIPPAVDELLYRGLALEPADRPTASECLAILEADAERPRESAPVVVASPRVSANRRGFRGILSVPVLLVALVVLAAMTGGVAYRLLHDVTPTSGPAVSPDGLSRLTAKRVGDMVILANDGDQRVADLRLEATDQAGLAHHVSLAALGPGENATLRPESWTPPLSENPEVLDAAATVAGAAARAPIPVVAAPAATTSTPDVARWLTAELAGDLLITSLAKEPIADLRLEAIDSANQVHTTDVGTLAPGESAAIWAGKWRPALPRVPESIVAEATIGGVSAQGRVRVHREQP